MSKYVMVPLSDYRALYQAYVSLLESGRDRITSLGGSCDAVDVMERGDPYLRRARDVIAAAAPREPAPAVDKIASFLKERDEALVPGEATDEERIASAQVIAEMFSGRTPPAPPVDAELEGALIRAYEIRSRSGNDACMTYLNLGDWEKAVEPLVIAIQASRQQGES